MNTSLSTVDSIFNNVILNTNAQPNRHYQQQQQQHHRNYSTNTAGGQSMSFDHLSPEEQERIRNSPSFVNDSEPPSYFEAIGIGSSGVLLSVPQQQQQQQQQQQTRFLSHGGAGQPKPSGVYQNSSFISGLGGAQPGNKSISMAPSTASQSSYQQATSSTAVAANHQRQHVLRSHLPPIYQQTGTSSYSYSSHNLTDNSIESRHKPSETYLVWSIFTTIYCVFIGIFALIYSIQVYHYNKQGEFQKANKKSMVARNLNFSGLFVGIIYLAVGFLLCFFPR